MLVGGAPALRAGAAEVSRVGNEGRALALYGMLQTVLPRGNERADVHAHLDALKSWRAALNSASQMQRSGSHQRTTTDRAMFEPTPKAMGSARDATITWIHRALELNTSEAAQTGNFERDEAIEAYRALRAGGFQQQRIRTAPGQ